MRSSRSFVLPLLLLASASVQAQTGPVLGSTVRISSRELRSGHGSGVLQRVTADSLVVSGKAVSRSSIGRIDVSSGRKANLLKGMGIGFVSGVAVGGLVCYVACDGYQHEFRGMFTAIGAGVGGLAGLGVGALIGSHKTEQWHRSSLSTLTISPTVGAKGGLGLSLGFRF